MSEIKYTATKKIINGGTVTEITDRDAFISSSGTAHYENCSVVTRMFSGGGQNRMASRNVVTAEVALNGIRKNTYTDCTACTKIHAKRTDEYSANETLITPAKTETDEEPTMATETNLPDGVKDTPSTRAVYTAMLKGAHGTVTEIAETSGVTVTSVKRALAALLSAGAASSVDTGKKNVAAQWSLTDPNTVQGERKQPEVLELLGSDDEDTTLIPGLGEIRTATLNLLATGNPEMTGNEKRARDLLAKTFKTEWTALTDPQQAAIAADYMAGEQAEPESFDAKSYRKDIGTNNLLTYANGILAADMRESMNPDFDTDDDLVDADEWDDADGDPNEVIAEEERQAKRDADDADLEADWNSMNDDIKDPGPQDDDDSDDDDDDEPEQVVAPKPVKRVAKPKLKAAGVKKGQAYGYLSGTGLAHTAMCASVKAAELGTLNIPMGEEYRHPLADLLELVANEDIKECRLCAKLRLTAETKLVDVAKFVEFIKTLAKEKPADAPIAKTFSGFRVTIGGTGKDLYNLDLRGPASNQWSRRKDIERKNLARVSQELVKEVTSK